MSIWIGKFNLVTAWAVVRMVVVFVTLYPTALTDPGGPSDRFLELNATFPFMKVRRCPVVPGVHLRRMRCGGPVDFRLIFTTLFTDLCSSCLGLYMAIPIGRFPYRPPVAVVNVVGASCMGGLPMRLWVSLVVPVLVIAPCPIVD